MLNDNFLFSEQISDTEELLPIEVRKETIIQDMDCIFLTLKDNFYFTKLSMKMIIGDKNRLTCNYDIILKNLMLKSEIGKEIIEVIILII